ncbi:MAG: hypothetical protein ACUVUC_13575 [Thermoguttaceae bacterium]
MGKLKMPGPIPGAVCAGPGNGRHRRPTSLSGYSWAYDSASRPTRFTSSLEGTAPYRYATTSPLTAADYHYQADEASSYNANGNRVTANGSPRASYSLTWDNANQLTREVSNDGTVNFSYDAIGQLIAVSGWRPETYS